ncbi:MAG: exodeoxyribonuclease VII large subunit [Phycisphaerales bacterium]
MGRLPFDPDRMKAKEAAARRAAQGGAGVPGAGGEAPPMRVSQLAAAVDEALRAGLPRPVRVIGEVSSFTDRTHWYFTLKDAGAVVSCVMFQSAAKRSAFTPAPGQEIVVSGHVEYYAPQGRLTLRVERVEPVGAGALELAYRKLCEELRSLGWFAQERKRPVPTMPRRIGVITSRTGAALQDVLDTARRRAPFVEIGLVDTLVQGPGAAPAIARAISWVSAHAERLGIDTLIVTRGGGSIEDLWAFNDREVAAAIVRCSIPVAAAIGHETDTTIAELVADLRCATPTQAAMRCTPDASALREQVVAGRSRLGAALRSGARRAAGDLESSAKHLARALPARAARSGRLLERLAARLEAHRPSTVYERRRAALHAAAGNLRRAMLRRIESSDTSRTRERLGRAAGEFARRTRERLEAVARELELVGPAGVIARGYSLTLGPDGTPLRSASSVRAGDVLTTRLADGSIDSVVREGRGAPVPGLDRPPQTRPPRRSRSDKSGAPDGPGLFGP